MYIRMHEKEGEYQTLYNIVHVTMLYLFIIILLLLWYMTFDSNNNVDPLI